MKTCKVCNGVWDKAKKGGKTTKWVLIHFTKLWEKSGGSRKQKWENFLIHE